MIQNIIIQRIKQNALAIAKFEKIRKANETKTAVIRPSLLAPKFSPAEIQFIKSL